jgi:alpha-mannosidase
MTGGVVHEAYELNNPLMGIFLEPAEIQITRGRALQPSHDLPTSYRFAEVHSEHVMLETVKKAEDGEAWVIRLYEFKQSRSRSVDVEFEKLLLNAVECNLMEEEEQPVRWEGNRITFPTGPYEVKTFKVWF